MEAQISCWLTPKTNHTHHMKTFIVTTEIKVTIKAESLEAAEDMFLDTTISFQDEQGEEMEWELIDSQIKETKN